MLPFITSLFFPPLLRERENNGFVLDGVDDSVGRLDPCIPLITTTTLWKKKQGRDDDDDDAGVVVAEKSGAERLQNRARGKRELIRPNDEEDETKAPEVRSFVVNAFGETFDVEVFPSKSSSLRGLRCRDGTGRKGRKKTRRRETKRRASRRSACIRGRVRGENGRGPVASVGESVRGGRIRAHRDAREEHEREFDDAARRF